MSCCSVAASKPGTPNSFGITNRSAEDKGCRRDTMTHIEKGKKNRNNNLQQRTDTQNMQRDKCSLANEKRRERTNEWEINTERIHERMRGRRELFY